jgi:uncharacterized membrane protein
MEEKRIRSILKSITWRVIATLTTMVLVYVFTGDFIISVSVGTVEMASKMVFYYLHERIWNFIGWGKA